MARVALIGAGASFTMFVICRAIDPTTVGKASLTSALLQILHIWRPASAKDESGNGEVPEPPTGTDRPRTGRHDIPSNPTSP